MENENIVKRIVAVIFVLALGIGFIKNDAINEISIWGNYIFHNFDENGVKLNIDDVESDFSASLTNQKELIDFNGTLAKILGMKSFYKDQGVYINDKAYIVSAYPYTSTDYEYEETIAFRDFLEENNINLIYVNEPAKYMDDSAFVEEFGVETYSNRNTDRFLERIRAEGVNTIDLRENIVNEGIDINDLFYRTDHHWTTAAGLWASGTIAEGLNEYCGYSIDMSIFDFDNYEIKEWDNCWIGEQGRLVARTYIGLDNYAEIKPAFDTSYTFMPISGEVFEGSFDNFVKEETYNTERDIYENPSWHYSYDRTDSINHNISNGKILMLCDSYDHVTVPFLSLGVHELDSLILREYYDSLSLRDYILEGGYDTVIIAYAQFMLGAHDNPDSANYRMFAFNE